MTDPGAMWFAFGNPTVNTGRFSDCFGRLSNRWKTWQIDSRTAKLPNKEYIKRLIEDYGEDSDYVRVRVKGQFPRAAFNQLISLETVEFAMARKITAGQVRQFPVVVGVDVAREGDDDSATCVRQGLAVLEMKTYRVPDGPSLGNIAYGVAERYKADAVFVDSIGVGASVVDYMRLIGMQPIDVVSARKATNEVRFANLRMEMWWKMNQWLINGGCLPFMAQLRDELTAPLYVYTKKDQYLLESKKDMKSRGQKSPDMADALAMTFAFDVQKKQSWQGHRVQRTAIVDYDVLKYGMEVQHGAF